jgi:hypothetical protein
LQAPQFWVSPGRFVHWPEQQPQPGGQQKEPQTTWSEGQQTPWLQLWPVGQAVSQKPQWLASLLRSVQTPPQQLRLLGHAWPHVPQFEASLSRS